MHKSWACCSKLMQPALVQAATVANAFHIPASTDSTVQLSSGSTNFDARTKSSTQRQTLEVLEVALTHLYGVGSQGCMSYSPSSSSNSPSSSAVASWYCWYSDTRSFMFDSASVNSISSMPSPVYQ